MHTSKHRPMDLSWVLCKVTQFASTGSVLMGIANSWSIKARIENIVRLNFEAALMVTGRCTSNKM